MRRRIRPDDERGTPLRLRRYVSSEWDGQPQRWYDARDAYNRETGEPPAADPDTKWPDVPFDPRSI
ncbi:hypothetical protein ACOACO_18425 [Nocardioides sp. CPCC 205120]|uniref:hypothetical protein n=1 Tax=Nocardioides sp. CPCC 205120 TaxID=3406462 RepID=UPI003B50142F